MRMRRRGTIFKNFKDIEKSDNEVVKALETINNNLKLVLEVLCDLRLNTSEHATAKNDQK